VVLSFLELLSLEKKGCQTIFTSTSCCQYLNTTHREDKLHTTFPSFDFFGTYDPSGSRSKKRPALGALSSMCRGGTPSTSTTFSIWSNCTPQIQQKLNSLYHTMQTLLSYLQTSDWMTADSLITVHTHTCTRTHAHIHTHMGLTALCSGLPGWAGTRKVKTNLDFTDARDSECHWHQLDYMQVCTSPRHANTPP